MRSVQVLDDAICAACDDIFEASKRLAKCQEDLRRLCAIRNLVVDSDIDGNTTARNIVASAVAALGCVSRRELELILCGADGMSAGTLSGSLHELKTAGVLKANGDGTWEVGHADR